MNRLTSVHESGKWRSRRGVRQRQVHESAGYREWLRDWSTAEETSANAEGLTALAFLHFANFDILATVCGESFTLVHYWELARHKWVEVQETGLSMVTPVDGWLRRLVRAHMPGKAVEWSRRATVTLLAGLVSMPRPDRHDCLVHALRLLKESSEELRRQPSAPLELPTFAPDIHSETVASPSLEVLHELSSSVGECDSDSLLTSGELEACVVTVDELGRDVPASGQVIEIDIIRAGGGDVLAWRAWLSVEHLHGMVNEAPSGLRGLPPRISQDVTHWLQDRYKPHSSESDAPSTLWVLLATYRNTNTPFCADPDLNLELTTQMLSRLASPNTWFVAAAEWVCLVPLLESSIINFGIPVPLRITRQHRGVPIESSSFSLWCWRLGTMPSSDKEEANKRSPLVQPVLSASALAGPSRTELSRSSFVLSEDDVRQILRRLHHIPWLNDFVKGRALPFDGVGLRDRVLGLLIADVPPEPLTKEHQRVLRVTYLDRPGTTVAISTRLAMSRSTYYRQLGDAHEQLTVVLSAMNAHLDGEQDTH